MKLTAKPSSLLRAPQFVVFALAVSLFCFWFGFITGAIWLYLLSITILSFSFYTCSKDNLHRYSLILFIFFFGSCFFLSPDLSDDYHRYLWEGHVLNRGYSPYQYSPETLFPTLDHPSEGLINNQHLPAIYPPLAQYLFAISDGLSNSVLGWKIVIFLWSLAWSFLLRGPWKYTLFFCPVLLIEGWWNAHLDLAGIMPAFVFLQALQQNNAKLAGVSMGSMIALKIMPIIWFPIAYLHLRGKERLWFCIFTFGVLLAIYAPFFGQIQDLFYSFITFSKSWHFNNLIYTLLDANDLGTFGRPLLAILFLLTYSVLCFTRLPVEQKFLSAWMLLIVCSPTFFPWYMIWLVPFVPQSKQLILLIAYGASTLSYLVLINYRAHGNWAESWYWLVPEWLILSICFGLLAWKPKATSVSPAQSRESATLTHV